MNSSKRIICKICFRRNVPLELIKQLCFYTKGLDKLFCNKYNPSVWHSEIPQLQSYSEGKAEKELQRLFKNKKEYFLDAYKLGHEEFILVQTETHLWGYLIFEETHFSEIENDVIQSIDEAFVDGHGICGYCCEYDDLWWYPKADQAERSEQVDMRRRMIYAHHNTKLYERDQTAKYVANDEIWLPATWQTWLGEDFFKALSLKDVQVYLDQEKIPYRILGCGLHAQLFDKSSDYALYQSRIENFREYLNKNNDLLLVSQQHKVEIKTGYFAHGGNLYIRHYLNDKGELSTKERAVGYQVYEYKMKDNTIAAELVFSKYIPLST